MGNGWVGGNVEWICWWRDGEWVDRWRDVEWVVQTMVERWGMDMLWG